MGAKPDGSGGGGGVDVVSSVTSTELVLPVTVFVVPVTLVSVVTTPKLVPAPQLKSSRT